MIVASDADGAILMNDVDEFELDYMECGTRPRVQTIKALSYQHRNDDSRLQTWYFVIADETREKEDH